ncbi:MULTISPECIES: aromatic ring-hydroxylating dioxygenase subunit alpha [Ramlibacter]|uniref:Rieske 2Fe-2S domain-containing protein n=1 Tax=Ramlibacter pinisoli TaxID=2682844 RepID=A0A6N8IMB4_9BURK|nr:MULTISPECIES: aromatic ring-hydroxylating dioxygenase subunit alpha [Ramlibacter]MBA2960500.1 aromatic ring-hydroxylating dioxygenase subunit alpha [Ramlibacter sp. CGMCC 1.13660]MVQ27832.1 Rieske 2Fe-2S domain-containing protein [Ramlibacter pinisoli]
MQIANIAQPTSSKVPPARFPRDQWYVAGFSSELTDQPLARTFLGEKVVLFRTGEGQAAALEDRCCHRSLPLSCGTVEGEGLRCGYHGMLYNPAGQCIEIPGQERVPSKAKVRSYHLVEQNKMLWIWMPAREGSTPGSAPPVYPFHEHPNYKWGSGMYHYQAPWQLIHDNLMDLSHLGYVHLKTIGGNAKLHMNAKMNVTQDGDHVKVVRQMPGSTPPPTYKAAWPFGDKCERWQEIEFHLSHLRIWTGACEPGTDAIDDPQRGGFHMRGLHGITPETAETCHYFWSMASTRHPDMPENIDEVIRQTAFTFDEDRVVIEKQYQNMREFGERADWLDIHVDVGANRARRVVQRLTELSEASKA